MRILALMFLVVLVFALMGAFSPYVDAHVTRCPDPPAVPVELVQWWSVETRNQTGGCSVSVNASDYDSAAQLGVSICGGTVKSVSAGSSRANEPTRWTE